MKRPVLAPEEIVVPGEVLAEARLERAVFCAYLESGTDELQLGEVRVQAKRIFCHDKHANGYPADIGDVIDKLVAIECLAYNPRGGFLTLTPFGKKRAEALRQR